jgi:6-phosphogluconolactonase (cycloisomerase 2 family)
MHSRLMQRVLVYTLPALFMSAAAFATTPTITVQSPANDSTTTSPVLYTASASSPDCTKGISAMRVYSAPGVSSSTISGGNLDAYVNLTAGTYRTTIVAWDNCGGTATKNLTVTVSGESKPDGFVYTVNSNYYDSSTTNKINNVVGFTILSNGALAQTAQGPVAANVGPFSVASDKGGYRLYVGDKISGDVFAYFINRDNGYLTPVPGAPFPVNRSVTAVAVHPSGSLVFATRDEQAAGDGVAVFQLQSNGSLVEGPGSPYSTEIGPQAIVVDPSGKYLYVADEGSTESYINAFQIDLSAATLTPVSGSPFVVNGPSGNPNCPSGVVTPSDIVDFNGSSVYTADAINYISGFAIGMGGALTQYSGSPWADNGGCPNPNGLPSSWDPYSLAIDGSGKFLYAANISLNNISIYSIASNGTLTFIKNTGTTGGCFTPIRTNSAGNQLYIGGCGQGAANGDYSSIVGYSINSTTGDLTLLPASPYTFYENSNSYPTFQDFVVTQ